MPAPTAASHLLHGCHGLAPPRRRPRLLRRGLPCLLRRLLLLLPAPGAILLLPLCCPCRQGTGQEGACQARLKGQGLVHSQGLAALRPCQPGAGHRLLVVLLRRRTLQGAGRAALFANATQATSGAL